MHGVKRVLIFCTMTAVVPAILIITPLYLRHYVFADVTFPVAESDVLAIQEGISSIFCDSIGLRMNTSFNAFHMVGTPVISGVMKHIRLKKSMTLPDDTLEYWGFYLMKGASVKLKVCSRYDGSRILVVRGGKDLNTCGLMEHNMGPTNANMDAEYKKLKTYDEKSAAENLGLINEDGQYNNAGNEDLTDDSRDNIKKWIDSGKTRSRKDSETYRTPTWNEVANYSKGRHRKRHIRKWNQKLTELKNALNEEPEEQEPRTKRSISPLDAQIKHGGNARNVTLENQTESISVSSFESDLLTCYAGRILLTRGFLPSRLCNNINYLDQSNHMVTEHMVASDAYYYYIFYSDNDFVKNDIHAVFDIYKPTYRFANTSSGKECINQTVCEFPLGFMANETVIVEVPTRDGIEHEEDDITLLTSTCKPRVGVYVIFPILVLVLVLLCAFL